jgi:phosphate starvation-inducible PhoH-like protein|tara:strand:- start:730 stop:1497 length:768 start_codon:yes stop_codon:yes gene_type:complete
MAKTKTVSRARAKTEERIMIKDELEPDEFFSRPPMKSKLRLREFCWTERQKEFFKLGLSEDTRIMFVNGPAGTSKSLLSVYCGLKLMNYKTVTDMMYLRSAVESSDAKLGFLPGTAEDKLAFYNLPFLDKLDELLTSTNPEKLEREKRISMFPVNFARGMSWNGKFIILDEAQNCTQKEITTVMTRLGHGSRLFILADPMQTDLKNGIGAFEKMFSLFTDEDSQSRGIHTFTFNEDDIMRSELVKYVTKKINRLG